VRQWESVWPVLPPARRLTLQEDRHLQAAWSFNGLLAPALLYELDVQLLTGDLGGTFHLRDGPIDSESQIAAHRWRTVDSKR
jgi:hypothetical protein